MKEEISVVEIQVKNCSKLSIDCKITQHETFFLISRLKMIQINGTVTELVKMLVNE